MKKFAGKYRELLIIAVAVCAVFAQVVVSYTTYSSEQIKENIRFAETSLQGVVLSDENFNEVSSKIALNIYNNDNILKIFETGTDDFSVRHSAKIEIQKLATVSDFISGAYIYSKNLSAVYSVAEMGFMSESEYSKKLISQLNSEKIPESFYISGKGADGYEIEKLYYTYTFDKLSGDLVLIEADYKKLFSQYSALQRNVKGKLVIFNENGSVMYSGTDINIGDNVESASYLKNLPKEGEYKNVSLNGEKSALFCQSSSNGKRFYALIIPMSVLKPIKFFGKSMLVFYIGILASGVYILVIFSLASKIKVKTKELLYYIGLTGEKPPDDGKSVFSNYFASPSDETCENLKAHLKKITAGEISIFTVKICDYKNFVRNLSTDDIKLYHYGIDNILTEILNEFGAKSIFAGFYSDKAVYFLYDCDILPKYDKTAKKAKDALKLYMGVNILTAVTSNKSIDNLNLLHNELLHIEQYEFIYGKSAVLSPSVIKAENGSVCDKTMEMCVNIRKALINGENTKNYVNSLFAEIANLTVSEAHKTVYELMYNLKTASETLAKNGTIEDLIGIVSFSETERMETLAEVYASVNEIIGLVESSRANINDSRRYTMINKCMKIIESEYMSEVICAESIAEELGVSANYLGRNFRNLTGVSIADKIMDYKLNEAKRLLEESNESIKNIMVRIGATNRSYFAACFRKRYGAPPSAYRKNYRYMNGEE